MADEGGIMRPEDDPRFLGIEPQQVDPEIEERLRTRIAVSQQLIDTLTSPGWTHIKNTLDEEALDTRRLLEDTRVGVKSLDEIFAQRERLKLIRWLQLLEAATRDRMKKDSDDLYELLESRKVEGGTQDGE